MVHGIESVVEADMCIGCGVCSAATGGSVRVSLGPLRVFRAELDGASELDLQKASRVCPFSDLSPNEDELAAPQPDSEMHRSKYLGLYTQTFAGRVADRDYLLGSSSGGLASWLTGELLRRGIVDGVINVGQSGPEAPGLVQYGITQSVQDPERRKSQYYACTLAEVLGEVRELSGHFALVGVPCFVKAARALCVEDPEFQKRITVFVGLVCGHYKSHAFAESLAWQVGVPPELLAEVDFRIKKDGLPANHYDFGARQLGSDAWHSRRTLDLVGGNWGHVAFQPSACDYCDDVVGETADVSIGDAWLDRFMADDRGTNVVISRNRQIDKIFADGAEAGAIVTYPLSEDEAVRTQAGGFRYRRDGLAIRLSDDLSDGKPVPRKRVLPATEGLGTRRAKLMRQRRRMARLSHSAFTLAREQGDLEVYLSVMRREIASYRRLEATFARRMARVVKRRLVAAVASARRRLRG